MNFILDTDICIYWLKGNATVRDRFYKAGASEIAISVITIAELFYGAYNSSRMNENLGQVETFTNGIDILQLSLVALRKFGEMKSTLQKSGQLITDFDLLIASTAIAENRVLVTNNIKHFDRISELKLENWLLA
ncbi:MAG: type II toxin-antitoxin system VapC family toxin [Chloroflexi bacterium]|nr:type II toxin-antitoxin system VapC family toxin [Chloroflexota bacterium]